MEHKRQVLACLFCFSLVVCLSEASGTQADSCDFEPWTSFRGDELLRHKEKDAYYFVTDRMRINADGAPNAYHPADSGLDYNANAGYPGTSWWRDILVVDPVDPSKPYVQTHGRFAGFFVSKTALFDPSLNLIDPNRYVDAREVPYLVFPEQFLGKRGTGRLGDFGLAMNLENGKHSPFIVADIGPADAQLGEVSIALATALGGENVNPRNGAGRPEGRIAYLIFRFSSAATFADRWRLEQGEIVNRTSMMLRTLGDVANLEACFQ